MWGGLCFSQPSYAFYAWLRLKSNSRSFQILIVAIIFKILKSKVKTMFDDKISTESTLEMSVYLTVYLIMH